MLSFNRLGNLGRLGNQMFQYASLKGIATNRGFDFCIPPKQVFGNIDANVKRDNNCIYDIFDLESKNNISITSNQVIAEGCFHFDENIFNNVDDSVDLFGYFQSEKYFKHIENDIRKDFSFDAELASNCKEFIEDCAKGREVISLHIRRGDYVSNPNHPVQTLEYYETALKKLPDNCLVIVFSDDSDWCGKQELFDNDDKFLISENNSYDADMCMMTFCDYHIIANSSFSWWGAWLAKSKKVIAPQNWFGGDCISKNVKDMEFGIWEWAK
jgi:hypothetical protein